MSEPAPRPAASAVSAAAAAEGAGALAGAAAGGAVDAAAVGGRALARGKLGHTRLAADTVSETLTPTALTAVAAAGATARLAVAGVAGLGWWQILADQRAQAASYTHRPIAFLLLALGGLGAVALFFALAVVPPWQRALAFVLLRRRLRAAGARRTSVVATAALPDGRPVLVRARVRRRGPVLAGVPALLGGAPGVLRQIVMRVRTGQAPGLSGTGHTLGLIHEAALDFDLVDDDGRSLAVDVTGARLVTRRVPLSPQEGAARAALLALAPPLGTPFAGLLRSPAVEMARVDAGERVVREGDRVTVFGYKQTVVDATAERGSREAPVAACLRAGADLPVIVFG